MDRDSSRSCAAGYAGSPGDLLQKDFAALIAIFDRELSRVADEQSTVRSHILEARYAAERGRHLSEELAQRLTKFV